MPDRKRYRIHSYYGTVEGCAEDGIAVFKGIPYAAPPVGNLRWKIPQEPEPWKGILDCTAFKKCASQFLAEGWSIPSPYGDESMLRKDEKPQEDCLYLNIWTSILSLEQAEKQTVLFVIHGGGFESGSGAVPVLDGANLARRGLTVVTINYRMGIFGFLMHPLLRKESVHGVSGNYGFFDQLQALKWVKENIRDFGGDSERITICGESAGGISVGMMYESPLAKGLFAGAIVQSAAGLGRDAYTSQSDDAIAAAEKRGQECMESLAALTLEGMRALPEAELLKISFSFLPVRDGYIWPFRPDEVFRNGQHNDVPLLLGSNRDEGSAWQYYFSQKGVKEKFTARAVERYGSNAEAFLRRYPVEEPSEAVKNMCDAYGEKVFGYSIHLLASLQAEYGRAEIFRYYYSRTLPGKGYGAYHSSELPYCFATQGSMDAPWENQDREIMRVFSSYFTNFASCGDPNGEDLPVWDNLRSDKSKVLEIGNHIGMIVHPQQEMFDLYMKQDGEKEWFHDT